MPPADLGEHNREVVSELGYSEEEIVELIGKGVLG
jgi:crotonobetainyl-CoA:carnitine CoA-transferase CaiB-like acyl-CoA transferase